MNATTSEFQDPKKEIVGIRSMKNRIGQLRRKSSRPRSDENDTINSDQFIHPSPKFQRTIETRRGKTFFNRSLQQQFHGQESIVDVQQSEQIQISEQAIAHCIDTRLPMIKVHCNPSLRSEESGIKFIKEFIKHIESNFRKEYPRHKDLIGFDQWWLKDDGNIFCGITEDIDFYMYLCDNNHYPSVIGNVQIKLKPPKQLPSQNSVVIRFIPVTISKDDMFDDMKIKFSSLLMVNEMMGTTRSNARHIRAIFKQQDEYEKILYEGKIGIQGLIFEVDEYLPTPKILICMKCNFPVHTKKGCQVSYAICRRCGQDKANGEDHSECPIQCHHCRGNHISTDYKCPTMVNFRKGLLDKLKHNTDKLPAHTRMFIPIDCRKPNERDRILTSSQRGYSAPPSITTTTSSSYPPAKNFWTN